MQVPAHDAGRQLLHQEGHNGVRVLLYEAQAVLLQGGGEQEAHALKAGSQLRLGEGGEVEGQQILVIILGV